MQRREKTVFWLAVIGWMLTASCSRADDGSRLWLRYDPLEEPLRTQYQQRVRELVIPSTDVFGAVREELLEGLGGLLGEKPSVRESVSQNGAVWIGTAQTLRTDSCPVDLSELQELGEEGFLIRSVKIDSKDVIVIAGNTERGALYGGFCFLRLLQTGRPIDNLSIREKPRIARRLLNHWDNLDGSVERGYAGRSIWKWQDLPERIDPRYKVYARANASIGINGAVLNNVNAQPQILSEAYLKKTAAIAQVLRPYGIRVYLSVKFTSPMELGGLGTCDPLEPAVRDWWKEKAKEIYALIPDFGGFLVKAYSEGQPGPQMYGRTHADGANLLAEALAPFHGIVMWRSFVYDLTIDEDRAKCAYLEFVPLDGQFAPNVLVQTKNGPVDFQPREPFNPLFGAMPKTPLMLELQITQEYTGQAKHLVYLGPQWKEVLEADTYAYGPGTTVGRIVDGSAEGHTLSGIAGVSGIGTDANWTGHPFSQANWYAFGRLAWDYTLSAETIAREWIQMTLTRGPKAVNVIAEMMAGSWEACVDYMTPLGLAHLMAEGHHYGPAPDYVHPVRHDWSSTYYHRASKTGIGFDRSSKGSNAVSQYHPPLRELLDDPKTCPEKYLLWFHHLPWDRRMSSGRTLWEEMQARYQRGVEYVERMQRTWKTLEGKIDRTIFDEVNRRLALQADNARQWRDVCLNYFGQFPDASIEKKNAQQ